MPALLAHACLVSTDVQADAKALLSAEDAPSAVAILEQHLQLEEGDAPTLELFGRALIEVQRLDEAAHWLDNARSLYEQAGKKRDIPRVEKILAKADPLAKERRSKFIGLVRDLTRAGDKLLKSEQVERALQMYQRALPLAEGKPRALLESNIEKILSADATVDLDAAGASSSGARPLISHESERYKLRCNLEEPVVHLLGVTLDDLFDNYVNIYFDGNTKRAPSMRPTIRIHGTWDEMAALWTDGEPSPGLGGWWSPGSQEIHTYDGRTRNGSLQDTLETLFHEASHQFMSAFVKGNRVPTWFNEGTACFFEGAQAMADGRILWPDAARGRLAVLSANLYQDRGPTMAEVIDYSLPGSYPGEYYSVGWGLVYFLQQWENPETLEYSYRPLYRRYLDESMGKQDQSTELFNTIILGEEDPLDHSNLEAFEKTWEDWIQNTVQPLYLSLPQQQLDRRIERAERYLAAADRASKNRKSKVTEEELLLRSLSDLEFARVRLTETNKLRAGPLESLIDVLDRLDREKAAAAVLEQYLDAVDDGVLELDSKEYATAERRLEGFDRGNYALRSARSRMKTQYSRMHALLEKYREADPPMTLRAYTYANSLTGVFADVKGWSDETTALHTIARETGLIPGKLTVLAGPPDHWVSILADNPKSFTTTDGQFELESVQPHGRIHQGATVTTPYNVRATVTRIGEIQRGSAHGLVACGHPEGDWCIVGIGHEGNIRLWHLIRSGEGSTRLKPLGKIELNTPLSREARPSLGVRVLETGTLEVSVDGALVGEAELGFKPHKSCHVGVFVRNGKVLIEDLVVGN